MGVCEIAAGIAADERNVRLQRRIRLDRESYDRGRGQGAGCDRHSAGDKLALHRRIHRRQVRVEKVRGSTRGQREKGRSVDWAERARRGLCCSRSEGVGGVSIGAEFQRDRELACAAERDGQGAVLQCRVGEGDARWRVLPGKAQRGPATVRVFKNPGEYSALLTATTASTACTATTTGAGGGLYLRLSALRRRDLDLRLSLLNGGI